VNVQNCRSCGAPIIWTETGKAKMPVDAEPIATGRFFLAPGGTDGAPRAVYISDNPKDGTARPAFDEPRYDSHFRSCPDAKGWRK
jgi:hypothetical protein